MKHLLLLSVLLTTIFTGCDKEVVTLDGEYVGTFTRTGANSSGDTSNVTLNISGKSYSGTSDRRTYPWICSKGTLDFKGSTLTVNGECIVTAEFNWTYIFEGVHAIEVNGDSLRLIKRYPQFSNVYNLKKVR